ncbi:MAG: hypothetical protein [Bacteriophage sp.]|nr:MAG: hypothetical protein [Bacteriophage sp.]
MASYPLIGKKTVYIDDMVISPDYVQDEAGTITLTPGTTEVASQSGTINVPNGSYEEMSFELNIICPSVRYLGMLFPELYHNAKFKRVISGLMSETGQVRFGGTECVSNTPRDIIIHNVCDGHSSAQDFRIPQALISAGGEFTVSLSDPFVVKLSGSMASGANGAVVMGELDLDTPSYYDEDSGTIKKENVQVTALTASPANISGKVDDHVTVNVVASPNGATGTITATVAETTKAVATDNGDGTWDIQLKQSGTGTVTFKSGSVQAVVNLNVAAA